MKRIESGDAVIYVQRHRGLSLFLLASALAALGLFSLQKEKKGDDVYTAVSLILICGASALIFLLWERAVFIYRAEGRVERVERSVWGKTRESLPLKGVEVRVRSAENASGRRIFWIWLESPNGKTLLFQGYVRGQDRTRAIVERLREDLGI